MGIENKLRRLEWEIWKQSQRDNIKFKQRISFWFKRIKQSKIVRSDF